MDFIKNYFKSIFLYHISQFLIENQLLKIVDFHAYGHFHTCLHSFTFDDLMYNYRYVYIINFRHRGAC